MEVTSTTSNQFQAAHVAAQRAALLDGLRGRASHMPTLEELCGERRITGQRALGLQAIEVRQIVGSEGRAHEFDGAFRPRAASLQERWSRVAQAMSAGVALPPIMVYKLGDRYVVCDGNHRVSVARHSGHEQINAYVTELTLDGPLAAPRNEGQGWLASLVAGVRQALQQPGGAAA
jgi:hypothetical protein